MIINQPADTKIVENRQNGFGNGEKGSFVVDNGKKLSVKLFI